MTQLIEYINELLRDNRYASRGSGCYEIRRKARILLKEEHKLLLDLMLDFRTTDKIDNITLKDYHIVDTNKMVEISDEEIEIKSNEFFQMNDSDIEMKKKAMWKLGAKWYREQLKQKL